MVKNVPCLVGKKDSVDVSALFNIHIVVEGKNYRVYRKINLYINMYIFLFFFLFLEKQKLI